MSNPDLFNECVYMRVFLLKRKACNDVKLCQTGKPQTYKCSKSSFCTKETQFLPKTRNRNEQTERCNVIFQNLQDAGRTEGEEEQQREDRLPIQNNNAEDEVLPLVYGT